MIKLLFYKDALYCIYSFNGFTILLFILLFIGSLFGIFWYENATSLKIEFKEYFSGKIANAKKQIKRTIISFIVLCVLFLTFLCFQIPSRVVATTDCITEYHLISKDTTINKFYKAKEIQVKRWPTERGRKPLLAVHLMDW